MSDLQNGSKVKEFVEYIVRSLCDDETVEINEVKGDRTISINIKCNNKENIGKIIGKKGRVANAIRLLATHVAYNEGVRVVIAIID